MCFHGVIKTTDRGSIFGSGWRKYGEKMERVCGKENSEEHTLKLIDEHSG